MITYVVKRTIVSKIDQQSNTVQQIAEYFTQEQAQREIERCIEKVVVPKGVVVTYSIEEHGDNQYGSNLIY